MQFKENGLEMFPKHVKMSCITYHTSSVARLTLKSDHENKLWFSFSVFHTDFKNVIFEKIHRPPSEDAEVAEVKRPRNPKRRKF